MDVKYDRASQKEKEGVLGGGGGGRYFEEQFNNRRIEKRSRKDGTGGLGSCAETFRSAACIKTYT